MAAYAFPLKHSVNVKEGSSLDFRSSDTGCECMASWEGDCSCIETFLPDFLHLRKAQPKGWQGCSPLFLSVIQFPGKPPFMTVQQMFAPGPMYVTALHSQDFVTKYLLVKAEFCNFCPIKFLLALQMWDGRAPKGWFRLVLTWQSWCHRRKAPFQNMPLTHGSPVPWEI